MQKLEKHIVEQRTEEVQDIIDRMPGRTSAIVAVVLSVLVAIMLCLGYIIKYPESVSAQATIRAAHAPVKLMAQTSGKIHLIPLKDSTDIKADQIFAYIESSVNIYEVLYLDSLLQSPIDDLITSPPLIQNSFHLGELTRYYCQWINHNKTYHNFLSENTYDTRYKHLQQQIKGNQDKRIHIQKQKDIQEEALDIAKTNCHKDSIQFYQLKTITESQYLQSKATELNLQQQCNTSEKEFEMLNNVLLEQATLSQQIRLEKQEQKSRLYIDLNTSHSELFAAIQSYKQKYTFTAPYCGQLELMGFWKENDFVQAGQELFSIVPTQNPVCAELILPAQGAGKVKIGQEVIIKLENYPYLQFGSLSGKVSDISSLAKQYKQNESLNNLSTYFVRVELPQQLTTNYGSCLDFAHDLSGTAEILTKKRRLIQRLFDNLKYINNQ